MSVAMLLSMQTASAALCPLPAISAGGPLTTMIHGGVTRSWYTYVPASVAASQAVVPLVVDLHGYSSCAVYSMNYTRWLSKAEEFGSIVVWPQAEVELSNDGFIPFLAGENAAWNAGSCCRLSMLGAPVDDVDDEDFLRKVVEQVAAAHPVDTTRVYFTGHSNGAMMAQRMLAQASDMVAAVVGFAGQLMIELGSGYTPRPVMIIHGTADATNPYNGTVPNPGAEENLAAWGSYNGCPGTAPTKTTAGYTLHRIDCKGAVSELVELPGVGHYPYYGNLALFTSTTTTLVDTTQLAWDFLNATFIKAPATVYKYKLSACQNRQGESASPAEGYALQLGQQTIATTKTRFLDSNDAEIAKLSNGLTMMAWVRWNDATQNRLQPPVTIGNEEDPDFWKPFNTLATSLLAGRELKTSGQFDWQTDQEWHHVTVSWNNMDGAVRVWIDGSNSTEVFAPTFEVPHGVGKSLLGQQTLCVAAIEPCARPSLLTAACGALQLDVRHGLQDRAAGHVRPVHLLRRGDRRPGLLLGRADRRRGEGALGPAAHLARANQPNLGAKPHSVLRLRQSQLGQHPEPWDSG